MKKIIALLLVASTFFISCSKTDEPLTINPSTETDEPVTINPSSSVLVKKMVVSEKKKSNDSTYTSTSFFTYNGNKIIGVKETEYNISDEYTYTGNLITKQIHKYKYKGNVNDITTHYYYDSSENLVSSVQAYSSEPYLEKTVYTHNSDGTISYVETKLDTNTNTSETITIGILTFVNGNLTKRVRKYGSYTSTDTYEYDTKNNPSIYITGLNKLLNDEGINVNNTVKITESDASSSMVSSVFTYTYNKYDLPVKQVENSKYSITTTEFIY
jgi:hypothetical protein